MSQTQSNEDNTVHPDQHSDRNRSTLNRNSSVKGKKAVSNGSSVSSSKATTEQIRKANELMMQAWDMISRRKKSDSDAQADL